MRPKRNHGDGNEVACCCRVEKQEKEVLVIPAHVFHCCFSNHIRLKATHVTHANTNLSYQNYTAAMCLQFKTTFFQENVLKCRWGHAAMSRHCDRAKKYEVWELWANMSSLGSPESDTIVDPWTMMIHLQDAGLAWATESLHIEPHIWAHLRTQHTLQWWHLSGLYLGRPCCAANR